MKYVVKCTETVYSQTVVEAQSKNEARRIAVEDSELVWSTSDYDDFEITGVEEVV